MPDLEVLTTVHRVVWYTFFHNYGRCDHTHTLKIETPDSS